MQDMTVTVDYTPPQRECVRLEMPSGRQTPIDGEAAHCVGDHGNYRTPSLCVHVLDTTDAEVGGGDE